MKRMFLTCVLAICCVLTGYGQFWISFHWDSPGCDQCVRMESALRLSPKSAEKYHKIIHKYGKKIEKEARREYRYWDRAAERIYDLRMSRDREIQRLLSPSQFDLYIRLTRENPKRIHDYRGWYANPHYPDRKASTICIHFEDRYWGFHWGGRPVPPPKPTAPVPPPPAPNRHMPPPPPPRHDHPEKPKHPEKRYKEKKHKREHEREHEHEHWD